MSCQSQTENHISHPSVTTDQSKQIHSSQTNYQWHKQTKIQIGHHHKQVRLVTQKTDLRSEKGRYQTQTVRQRTSKTLTQAKIFD